MNTTQTMDITKVPISMWEALFTARLQETTRIQLQVEAIENDGRPQGTPDKKKAIDALLAQDFKHLMHIVKTNETIQATMHSAAHELLNVCQLWSDEGHKPCHAVIQADIQMILIGWKLACAYLECESLKNMT